MQLYFCSRDNLHNNDTKQNKILTTIMMDKFKTANQHHKINNKSKIYEKKNKNIHTTVYN